ncbi:hypothetical protein JVU11DRAFT_3099 [Chiua virens]|nr:hypothetical protein JVU11DRAFT_3099 [Chiua virens]
MDATSFTFLATILILVLLSASLLLRSYILRRRYRRRFQQAYADYPTLDGGPPDALDLLDPWERFRRRATRRGLGPKPVLCDIWILPPDKDDTCPSHPAALVSQPEPIPTPAAPSSPRPLPSFLSQLRIPTSFPSLSPPRQAHTHIDSPAKSPPPETKSPDSIPCSEKDTSTLSVYVFVAMPDASAPVHLPLPGVKGKGVHPLKSQAPHQGNLADPLLPSSLYRSAPLTRTTDSVLDDRRIAVDRVRSRPNENGGVGMGKRIALT